MDEFSVLEIISWIIILRRIYLKLLHLKGLRWQNIEEDSPKNIQDAPEIPDLLPEKIIVNFIYEA